MRVTCGNSFDECSWISTLRSPFGKVRIGSSTFCSRRRKVDLYEAKFYELSRHAPEMVDTPVKKARKFERGILREFKICLHRGC